MAVGVIYWDGGNHVAVSLTHGDTMRICTQLGYCNV